jgi:hypothetical protein
MTNYLTFTEPLSKLLHARLEALEHNRALGLSCIQLADNSKYEHSRYAYLLLAEQAMNGELVSIPTLVDFGYAPGLYTQVCSDCGKQHVAEKRATRCAICAEKALAKSVIGSSDA